jgi:hypothetical protein
MSRRLTTKVADKSLKSGFSSLWIEIAVMISRDGHDRSRISHVRFVKFGLAIGEFSVVIDDVAKVIKK